MATVDIAGAKVFLMNEPKGVRLLAAYKEAVDQDTVPWTGHQPVARHAVVHKLLRSLRNKVLFFVE